MSTRSRAPSGRSPRVALNAEKDSFFSIFSVNTVEHLDEELGEEFEGLGTSGEKKYLDIRRAPSEFICLLDKAFEEDAEPPLDLDKEKMRFLEFLQVEGARFERKGEYLRQLHQLVQAQGAEASSVEKHFFDFLPSKAAAVKSHSSFAKKFICKRLVALLEQYRRNEKRKAELVGQHGVQDFSGDSILEMSYNEYRLAPCAQGPGRLEKIRPAQVFLEKKRYDLYLLDLSVINR